MRTVRHPPAEHDRLVSLVSHLPHAVAAAVVGVQTDASLDLRGRGFTDTTRVAAGDAGLWRDIFLDNRENVIGAIDAAIRELSALKEHLAAGDTQELVAWLGRQAERRKRLDGQDA